MSYFSMPNFGSFCPKGTLGTRSKLYKLLAKCGDEVEIIQSPSGLNSSKFTLKKVHDRS